MFRFCFKKALQSVAVLLRTESAQRMNYMRLLKLLYICDKESLGETGQPITRDKAVAMKQGPVLSNLYSLIKGEHPLYQTWDQFVEKERFEIHLIEDPGTAQLSKYEIEKLHEVADRYRLCDEWDMVELTHAFAEWAKNDPGDSSKKKDIPLDDILESVGRSKDAEVIKKDAALNAHLVSLFKD